MPAIKINLTEENIAFIKANYLSMTAREIGKSLGLSQAYISKQLKRMELVSPKANYNQAKSFEIDLDGNV